MSRNYCVLWDELSVGSEYALILLVNNKSCLTNSQADQLK